MSKDGFDNESRIVRELDGKCFNELSTHFKEIIKKIYPSVEEASNISAEKLGGTLKSDIELTIDGNVYGISVKKGSGNSVHQEPLEEFIKYIKKSLDADEATCNCIASFIWGDTTTDGTGYVRDRVSAREYKKINPDCIDKIQDFFDENCVTLIERFLTVGVIKEKEADFIYYGNSVVGKIITSEQAVEYLCDNPLNNKPHVGGLSFQAWNRNINGGDKSETKRGHIQLKWGNLEKDINKITYEQ